MPNNSLRDNNPDGSVAPDRICGACGASHWRQLPVVGPCALLSDGQVGNGALAKMTCMRCGLASSVVVPDPGSLNELFTDNYQLYAHPIGDPFERSRQRSYALWINDLLGSFRPGTIFEVGCGNGSLLLALSELFPTTILAGIEPSLAAVKFAQAAGIDVRPGTLTPVTTEGIRADLLISVNVLEHVPDPADFLCLMKCILMPSGLGIVICPCGEKPSTELLIQDHISSFSRASFSHLFSQAGLRIDRIADAPSSLGPFVAVVFSAAGETLRDAPPMPGRQASELHDARGRYLADWGRLDGFLVDRIGQSENILCFGVGEAAHLLATYAPRTWAHVESCTADGVTKATFRDKKVFEYGSEIAAKDACVLLAVRPSAQAALTTRLSKDGYRVIRWDDMISE